MLTAEHMVEHSLLAMLAAPLIVVAWARLGMPRLGPGPPAVAWAAFVIVQWVFHLTPLLEESRDAPLTHAAEHLAFLAVGVWFWVPVLGRGSRMSDPERCLYLALAAPAVDLVGAALMVRGDEGAGVAMLAGSLPIVAAAIAIAWRWLAREEREAADLERAGGAAG
jgi:cytochrome c oxidase assembly factor CtaG